MTSRWQTSLLAAGFCCVASAQGPANTLYITANGGSDLIRVFGVTEQHSPTIFGQEGPIAVYGGIATTGTQPGEFGASYDLGGTFSGSIFTQPLSNVSLDATTDGVSNYLIDDAGDVYYTSTTYQLPTFMFSAGAGSTGISYDPFNQSLWVDQNGLVLDYSFGGALLGGFSSGLPGYSALAFDRYDGSLWMGTNLLGGGAVLSQFSVSGQFFQSVTLNAIDIEGMEFDETPPSSPPTTPEPPASIALGLGLAFLPFAGKRRGAVHCLRAGRRARLGAKANG
jgi:hypothetical protein